MVKRLDLIGDNSAYDLLMHDYCRNGPINTYRYLAEYMGIKPLNEPVTESRRDNMANNWLEMLKEGRIYAIDNEGNVADFGKAWVCEVESSYGCAPEVTLRVSPVLVMTNKGLDIHNPVRENVEYQFLKSMNEENQKINKRLKKENEELRKENEELKKENEELRKGLSDVIATTDITISYADNDPSNTKYLLPLSTRRSNTKTKMLKEMLNSMYGAKAFKYDIKKVIFSGPCTIIFWQDGTKTMVRQQGEAILDQEKGLAMAIAKRVYGDKGNYNNVFKRWIYGEDWKKKERTIIKAIKLAKKNKDMAEADILKSSMETNLDYTFAMAKSYIESNSSGSDEFQGKRKDTGVIDEVADITIETEEPGADPQETVDCIKMGR